MRTQRWMVLVVPALGLAGVLWLLVTGGMIWATLTADQRATVAAILGPRWAFVLLAVLAGTAVLGWLLQRYIRPRMTAAAQLAEQARIRLETDAAQPIAAAGGPTLEGLTRTINELVAQRNTLRADMAAQVRQASRSIDQERARLAALMAELTQSVVVCNLDGRVLLYNHRARMQFRALSSAPALAGGAELLGLGRSIYAAFDRQLVAHALESIQQRLERGAASPVAQFVTTTASGQLLRVQMAPVREPQTENPPATAQTPGATDAAAPATPQALAGFVLMLENVTQRYEQDTQREQLLHALTEAHRGSLSNLLSSAEQLAAPQIDDALRQRHALLIDDEARAMAARIDDAAARADSVVRTRWPLEDMLGADLLAAAQRRLETHVGCRVGLGETDQNLWLKVDSYSLLLALQYLAARLVDEFETRSVQLRLCAADAQRAQLDLAWTGQALSTETVMGWELDSMRLDGETSTLSVRDVVERHGGKFGFARERVRHEAFFRFTLPLAAPQEPPESAVPTLGEARPEFYDFDLFRTNRLTQALDEARLADLVYTVFDTETTGLDPSSGDEIIQIGATRISGGKLRRQESFEQLVDPRRPIAPAGIPIHGITPEMVAGQPTIDRVLPAFHAFALDTVLVAHNAAFDMRFLQLKQQQTGCAFDQPVLDTLLLSALVHPNQESHRLEAIAERFNITVIGRHTALGDALVTAEIFLRLLPLLQAMGIETLKQAREAAQKTYYARLKY